MDGDQFGVSATGIGDLDRDGVPDIDVGAFGEDTRNNFVGAVYILFLNGDGTVKASQKITEGVGGFAGALITSDRIGSGVANLGDLDGDGRPEVAVGARFAALTRTTNRLRRGGLPSPARDRKSEAAK